MLNKVIGWSMLIVPWLTLFFMKKEGIKRYMPIAIFSALMVTITYEIAFRYKWWIILESIVPWGYVTNVSYAYGAFFIGTMWIFYFTFKKFWLYLITNIIVDGIDAFFITSLIEGRKIIHYVNISKLNIFILMVAQSFILYAYQVWHEKTFKLTK